ncbi:MAG: hypothetical protein ACRDRR_24725 [Pseudonocardiaceae bacterium]
MLPVGERAAAVRADRLKRVQPAEARPEHGHRSSPTAKARPSPTGI